MSGTNRQKLRYFYLGNKVVTISYLIIPTLSPLPNSPKDLWLCNVTIGGMSVILYFLTPIFLLLFPLLVYFSNEIFHNNPKLLYGTIFFCRIVLILSLSFFFFAIFSSRLVIKLQWLSTLNQSFVLLWKLMFHRAVRILTTYYFD